MNLTAAQLAAIRHRGSNLLVAASAGAGKTEVLARRCADIVTDPVCPCAIDRLLVVTFTRAAAAELRVRIARMMRDLAAKTPDAAMRSHLWRQEILVEAAEIGTIDAWCGRVLREHYAEAGVDVAFRVLSEEDAHLLRAAVLDDLMAELHRDEDEVGHAMRAWIRRASWPDDAFLRTWVTDLNRFREQLVNPEAWLARQREPAAESSAERLLTAALLEECRFQHRELAASGAAQVGVLQTYHEQLDAWAGMLERGDPLSRVVEAIAAFRLKPGQTSGDPGADEVRRRWLDDRLHKAWAPDRIANILARQRDAADLMTLLLDVEARYAERLDAQKKARGAYEFGDVQRMALDLLGTPADGDRRVPTDIARRLQSRYAHVLVDEFQDTSPVQVELLRLVTRDAPGQANRFMVGDVKQSIYGFRQAEPRLFTELCDAYAQQREPGRVQYLSDNFRSHAGVLAPLNALFERLFDRVLGGSPYGDDERLTPGRASSEVANPMLDARPRVSLHILEEERRRSAGDDSEQDNGDAELVERIEREAQLAADQIHALLRSGVQIPQRSGERTVLRPLRLADVVILLRAAVHAAGQVAAVLRDNGIRCVTSGREALLDAVEVRDVCNVLLLLVNRHQDLPLAGYLRGPLVGLTERELLEIRAAGGDAREDFCTAVERCRRARTRASLVARLDAAMQQLDTWSMLMREVELPALIRTIFHESALLLLARAMRGGSQRVLLLKSLARLAASFAHERAGDVDEFVTYLESLAAEEIDPGALAAGEEDAVRIMTIHAAKGLEFPVVFLLGTGQRFNRRRVDASLQHDRAIGCGLRFMDFEQRALIISARHLLIAHDLAQRERGEELRLLYVAATRARERLLVVGHAETGAWQSLCDRFAAGRWPSLISRLCARDRLEWLMMAAAGIANDARSGLLDVELRAAREIVPVRAACAPAPVTDAGDQAAWTADDEAWLQRGRVLVTSELDTRWAHVPALLSVSEIKQAAWEEPDAETPLGLSAGMPTLARPACATAAAPADGRLRGTATHRLLERADLARLASVADVREEIERLVQAGRLSPDEAAMVAVDDIAWLSGTDLGRMLAARAAVVRREVPFVFAVARGDGAGHTLVRGVIDAAIDAADGIVLIDYKTDRARNADELAERIRGYRVQMQAYAAVAPAIFARPVAAAWLVFLTERHMEPVPLPTWTLSEYLAQ